MKKVLFFMLSAFYGTMALAQDTKNVDININKDSGGGNWYTSPWIWIVVAAVFILLLVALTRGGGRRD
jgi:hypothetical protein